MSLDAVRTARVVARTTLSRLVSVAFRASSSAAVNRLCAAPAPAPSLAGRPEDEENSSSVFGGVLAACAPATSPCTRRRNGLSRQASNRITVP